MFELKKIGIVRRASALLLDFILILVLATGFMFLLSVVFNYSADEKLATEYYNEWEDFRKTYAADVADYYGFTYVDEGDSYTITYGDEQSSLDDVIRKLDESNGMDEQTAVAYKAYKNLPSAQKVNAQYQYIYSMLFMMMSLGFFLSYMVLEFIIPVIFKNGQTIGKKVFSIAVVRYDSVKITNSTLFARTVLGKYAIETMFPLLLAFMFLFSGTGVIALVLIGILLFVNLLLIFATKNNTPIHDLICGAVVVDIKLQMIFASEEELIAKKEEAHKKKVQSEKYGVK